jgi:hypothetical protein
MDRSRPIAVVAVLSVLVVGSLSGATPGAPQGAVAARLAGTRGHGNIGLMVVNLDRTQTATSLVEFYHQDGRGPFEMALAPIAPGSAAILYAPEAQDHVQSGPYAAIVHSDREVGLLTRTEWRDSHAAAWSTNATPSFDTIVPLVEKDVAGATTVVSVQNANPEDPQPVEVLVADAATGEPVRTFTATIPAGTSVWLDLGSHPELSDLPYGFRGTMRLRADGRVAAAAVGDVEDTPLAAYTFNGQPVEAASTRLVAPFVRAGDEASRLAVANPGPGVADVTVRYGGLGGCAGQSFVHGGGSHRLPAGAGLVFAQGARGRSLPTGPSGLPDGCVASATVESTAPLIGAVVVESGLPGSPAGAPPDRAAAYEALAAEAAGTSVFLARVWNQFTAYRLTSAVAVVNVGSRPATATLEISLTPFRNGPGGRVDPCASCTVQLDPGEAHLWYAPAMPEWRSDSFGSGTVRSSEPVVAVVLDTSLNESTSPLTMDLAAFVGTVQAPEGGAPAPGRLYTAYEPLLLIDWPLRDPVPDRQRPQAYFPHAESFRRAASHP